MAPLLATEKSVQINAGAIHPKVDVGWLCSEGPYQDHIAALSSHNPGLQTADPANHENPLTANNAIVVLLEASSTGDPTFKKSWFDSPSKLEKHLKGTNDSHDKRRIYLVEGLAKDYVSLLGSHFYMDPSFWMRHERTCVWSNNFTPVSDALPQPSGLDPGRSFSLQFCELRIFSSILPNSPFFCQRTGRHVGMTPARHEEMSTTGILRRKVGYWCRKTSAGGWDVIILCDPQLDAMWHNKNLRSDIRNMPFQGGYVDFVPVPDRKRARDKPPHPHHSMLHDLLHYFENHADLIPPAEWAEPKTSSIFLQKIVAAHYLQLVDYIKAMLPSLELRLTSGWIEEEDQWRSLQTISRRCGNYSDDIEDTLLSLGYPLTDQYLGRGVDWKDCMKDFQYVYHRLKILKHRADVLMQSMTGLASIAGNRQNLEEAKRVKRLNLLALLFIPLAYTSSLFSMSDDFKPGANKFWVYWVSSLPAIFVTFCATYIMDFTLDETASWTWRPLMFWKSDEELKKSKQRRGTGVWRTQVK